MTRMSKHMIPQDQSAFDGHVRAITVIGSILAALLFTVAVAGSHVVRPAQAVAHGAEAPELRAPDRQLQRSGTLLGYRVLL